MNKKQAEAWQRVGEWAMAIWTRASDPTIPEAVALDPVWFLQSLREGRTLMERWQRLIGNDSNPEASRARLQAFWKMAMRVLPEFVAVGSKPTDDTLRVITVSTNPLSASDDDDMGGMN